ncbi:unnamed protein product, partial [marine sediment metagenome]
MAEPTNHKKEVKMYLNQKENDKFIAEVKLCGMSNSDYVKTMYVLGKIFVCKGKPFFIKEITFTINLV